MRVLRKPRDNLSHRLSRIAGIVLNSRKMFFRQPCPIDMPVETACVILSGALRAKSIYETWLLVALVELGSLEQDLGQVFRHPLCGRSPPRNAPAPSKK